MIKAVLFDIDNTLLDFDAYVKEALRVGFERFGLGTYDDETYEIFHRVNSGVWHELEQGVITLDELMRVRFNRVFAALGISYDGVAFEKYFREYLFDNAILIDGALEVLEHLRGRYILCTASNGPYEQQMNRLRVGGLSPYFSHHFISGKMGISKPAQEFFAFCLDEITADAKKRGDAEILPSEVLMVGDSLTSDMRGAVNSGLKSCFFDFKHSGKTGDLPLDYVIDNLTELRTIL